jgi:hypothetical protein
MLGRDRPQPKLLAATYVRMSTDHQQYSVENQMRAIEDYASRHQFSIVKRFADYGRSGVRLTGRAALSRLLCEVEDGRQNFTTFSSTTLADGADSKILMKAHTTNTSARRLVFECTTARNLSITTAVSIRLF